MDQASTKLINEESGAVRKTTTDRFGRYTFVQLPPGAYEVTAHKAGFKTVIRRGIALAVSQAATVNLKLTIGPASEQITVTENAPMVASAMGVYGTQRERARCRADQEYAFNGETGAGTPE